MGKKEKEILANLKKQGELFEMPVEDFVWDAIALEIDPKSKKKRFGWIWKLSIAITLFLGIIASCVTLTSQRETDVVLVPRNTIGLTQLNLVHKSPVIGSYNNVQQNDSEEIIEDSEELTLTVTSKNTKQTYSLKKEVPESNDVNVDDKNNFGKRETQQTVEMNGVKSLMSSSKSIREKEIAKDAISLRKAQVDNLNQSTDTIYIKNESDLDQGENNLNTSEIIPVDTINNVAVEKESNNPTIPIKNDENENSSRFSLLLYGGAGKSFRTIKTVEQVSLINHKNDHEAFGNTFNLGANIQFDLTENFFLRLGGSYKKYTDKYDFQHDIITHTTVNDYQYIQVPILVGFNLIDFEKMGQLALIGGSQFNFLHTAQSSWVDPALLMPVAHNSSMNQTPFRSATTSLTIGFDHNFNLSDKFKFHIIPTFDMFVNSVYKRKVDINQKPYAASIDFGISYNF